MKKKQKPNKLSLNKLQIAKISNLHIVKGGNEGVNVTETQVATIPTQTAVK